MRRPEGNQQFMINIIRRSQGAMEMGTEEGKKKEKGEAVVRETAKTPYKSVTDFHV